MTDEELDALVRLAGYHREHVMTGDLVLRNPDGPAFADAITALRAQLAEVQKINEELQAAVAIAEDYTHRAEAALAAQIEVDAGIITAMKGNGWDENPAIHPYDKGYIAACDAAISRICMQPHDRTALDRLLAEARVTAIREFERARADRERVRLDDDGQLDEIVSCGTTHLEHMGGKSWFLSMGFADGSEHCLWFNGKITMEERREPPTLLDKEGA